MPFAFIADAAADIREGRIQVADNTSKLCDAVIIRNAVR